jgi:quinoprotein relay system zinc metallohydrolase 1
MRKPTIPAPRLDRRAFVQQLGLAAAAPLLAMFGSAEAKPLAYNLKPQPIAPGVWLIAGAQEMITAGNGGAIANIAILDTSEGAVVIDTGPSRRFGVELEAAARALTGKPVVRAYITHIHPDHAFGNQAFAADAIRAPQGVINGLLALGDSFAEAMYRITGDWMRGTEIVIPKAAIAEPSETIGGRKFRFLILAGHTDCDLVVVDETSGIMFAGDMVFLDRAPTTPNADIATWRKSLATLSGMSPAAIVPGHGPVEKSQRSIVQTRDWLDLVDATLHEAVEKGLDMTEAAALPLPDWTNRIAVARYEFERSVAHIYPRLERDLLPRVDSRG